MRRPKLSPKAIEKVADLDEKLRWGLISAKRYDQEYERILLWDSRNFREAKIRSLRRRGKISRQEYENRLRTIRTEEKIRKKGTREMVSDPSLSSGVGRQPAFPHGKRSDRRKGRTAYLAKKSL